MPDKHAFLSPSSSERWFHCPPSAWLCEQFPDQGSVFAQEGTEAHSLCEYLVASWLGHEGLTDPRPELQYYTPEMEECCQEYLQYIRERVDSFRLRGDTPEVYVEQRVDLRRFIPESMGTSDCVIVSGDEIVIVDFKYGMCRVPASSLQLRIYALGACEMFSALFDFSFVHMVVFQPRISHVEECGMPVNELYAWAGGELKPRAESAFSGQGEFSVGEWCRNCRARRQCRVLSEKQLEIARFEFRDPPLLSDGEIEEILGRVDDLVAWANGVREYALKAALDGRKFAGWKLVEGKSFRKFTDDQEACARAVSHGFDPYEQRMVGLTALEKRMGRKEFRALLSDLVVRAPGKPVLVPVSDKRPELDPACVEFAPVPACARDGEEEKENE